MELTSRELELLNMPKIAQKKKNKKTMSATIN
jgi:hypothetical protein